MACRAYPPLAYRDDDDRDRIAFGPLVERAGDRLMLIDGVHRSLAAGYAGMTEIYAVVIEPQHTPPPPGEVYRSLTPRRCGQTRRGFRSFRTSLHTLSSERALHRRGGTESAANVVGRSLA